MYEDEDTEEGEEKPRTVFKANENGHSTPLNLPLTTNTTLVGAKRRKCNLTQKINLENKVKEESTVIALLNTVFRFSIRHLHYSIIQGVQVRTFLFFIQKKCFFSPGSSSPQPTNKFSPSLIFGTQPPKPPRSSVFPTTLNGHDLSNFPLNSSYKSLPLSTASATSTPPFLDPTTGALIAIVSNPHHAALLAQQHQQLLKSSSISPASSSNTNDEHDIAAIKSTQHPKKFPCLLCGRDFSNKSNLNRHHSIVHVALRNFECIRCPKKFKLRQGLKTHMQRCHGVNADEPTFVLQKHHLHNYHHHHHHPSPSSSSPSLIAQTNK